MERARGRSEQESRKGLHEHVRMYTAQENNLRTGSQSPLGFWTAKVHYSLGNINSGHFLCIDSNHPNGGKHHYHSEWYSGEVKLKTESFTVLSL